MRNRFLDLAVVVSLTLVAVLVPLRPPLNAPFDLLLILYLPGYALSAAVFPIRSLVVPERLLYSLGLSLALSAIAGLALHITGWGIRADNLSLLLGGICILSVLAAWTGRIRQDPYRLPVIARLGLAGSLLFGLSGLILAFSLLIDRLPASPSSFDGYTLLWIEDGAPSPGSCRIGIQSHEFSFTAYRIEIETGREGLQPPPAFALQPGETLEIDLDLPLAMTPRESIEVRLFRLDEPREPYRRVVLWPDG